MKYIMPFENEKDVMSVGELIELLEKMPRDLPVSVEGCDCYGWVKGATKQVDRGFCYVLILRDP